MARPCKEGLDYFPLSCQFSNSVKLLQMEFGPVGIGILVQLWQRIYGGKGYYTPWDGDVALMFANECGIGVNVVREVISTCLRRGIFDREKYEKYHILTSEGIQERYAEATERRISQKIDGRYLLVAAPSNWVNADNNSVNVDNNAVNVDRSSQSKVKESKVNKSKVKQRQGHFDFAKKDIDFTLNFADGSFAIDTATMQKYVDRYKNINIREQLDKMSDWLSHNEKSISEAQHFINGWLFAEDKKSAADTGYKSDSSLIERSYESAEEFFKLAIAKSMGENDKKEI